jgi:hypothetical protein
MKAIHWGVLGLMLLFVVFLLIGMALYIEYTIMEPMTHPDTIHDVQIKAVVVTVPVEVVRTVETIITATPLPPTVEVVALPPPVAQPTEVPTPQPTPCIDVPYIEMQPRDYVQGDALPLNRLYNVHATLYNGGTCIWDGYTLYSDNSVPVIDVAVPYTVPGERATFSIASGEVMWPMQYMIVMRDESGNFVPFANGTKDGCMTWTVETIGKTPGFQQPIRYGFSSKLTCGPGG